MSLHGQLNEVIYMKNYNVQTHKTIFDIKTSYSPCILNVKNNLLYRGLQHGC